MRMFWISALALLPTLAVAQPSPSLPGPPPVAPRGFATVLKPSPYGGYWVLMPTGGSAPPSSQADLYADDPDPMPNPMADPEPPPQEPVAGAELAAPPTLTAEPWERGQLAPGTETDQWTLERSILDAINDRRADAGLPPLQPHPQLTEAARGHSAEMNRLGYFDHASPTAGRTHFTDRLALAGISEIGKGGENIQKGPRTLLQETPEDAARSFAESWMNSQGHRDNILDERFVFTGVGVSIGESGVYATQVFTGKLELDSEPEPPSESDGLEGQ